LTPSAANIIQPDRTRAYPIPAEKVVILDEVLLW